jgi:hypothetical protein
MQAHVVQHNLELQRVCMPLNVLWQCAPSAATSQVPTCIAALLACASCTSLTMLDSTVSGPTRPARISTSPLPFTLPPITASPGCFVTGSASPVMSDSSALLLPASRVPSAGKAAPGSTLSTSPTCSREVHMQALSTLANGITMHVRNREGCSWQHLGHIPNLQQSGARLKLPDACMPTAQLACMRYISREGGTWQRLEHIPNLQQRGAYAGTARHSPIVSMQSASMPQGRLHVAAPSAHPQPAAERTMLEVALMQSACMCNSCREGYTWQHLEHIPYLQQRGAYHSPAVSMQSA